MEFLALDIGGANLKIADGKGYAVSRKFPLWKEPAQLQKQLSSLIANAPTADVLAVTMTGELADCFATKAEGVEIILDAVELASDSRQVSVYLTDGRLVDLAIARSEPLLAAASNWHALASFAGRFCGEETGLLIDIGSTTVDLIPIGPHGPEAAGRTDSERLASGELVYTGVIRSPLCALVNRLMWRGESCNVAQELFSTALDAYLLLGEISEDPSDIDTADGRGRTKDHAHARLARMICADTTIFSYGDAIRAAEEIREAQLEEIRRSAERVLVGMESSPRTYVISGQGEFLAQRTIRDMGLKGNVVSLSEELGEEVSHAACAYALATLAHEGAAV